MKFRDVKESKRIYGLSRMALINYEKKGLLKSLKTPGGIRRYRVKEYMA